MTPPDAGRVAFRVRVGVAGHRQLADDAAVTAAIRATLDEIRGGFPVTDATPVEFSFVSALAEGADRLLLSAAEATFGVGAARLEAVLPLEPDDYERDFAGEASVAEFRRLLDGADSVVQVPPVDSREEAYERAGRQVVDRCDILVAVWDGVPTGRRGGTSDTVAYARAHAVPVLVVSVTDDTRPARTPSVGRAATRALREAWTHVAEYNTVSFDEADVAKLLACERRKMDRLAADSPIRWWWDGVIGWGLPHLVRADHLALTYQRRYVRLGETLFAAAALAVTAVAAQVVFAPEHPIWAIVEVALMLLLLAGVAIGRRSRIHDQWIAHRSLAEAFRAGTFIALTGLDDRESADGTSDDEAGQRWFQRAFTEAWRTRPPPEVPSAHAAELRRLLAEGWIERQIAYHRRAVTRFRRGQTVMTRGIVLLFGVSFVIGVLHVAEIGHEEPWPDVLSFLAITLPGFGAALSGIRDQRQFRLHAERSERTAARLERVRRALAVEASLGAIQRLALDAQAVITEENLDWSSVIEFQDVEIIL